MLALTAPAYCLMIGLLFEAGMGLSYHAQSERIIRLACERSTKPTRTLTPKDDSRRGNVLSAFDSLLASSGQKVNSRDAKIDWLNTTITATFEYETLFAGLIGTKSIAYDLEYQCAGIPPYPHDGEVILSSALTKPDGSTVKLKYGQTTKSPSGCWGVYPATDFGWDSGAGPGIEVQDWSNEYCRTYYGWVGLPPADFPSPYAIELDSWSNSSMTKLIELHPGKYEVSVWYNGRRPEYEGSNGIDIYLERLRPVVMAKKKIISMAQDKKSVHWEKYTYQITVDSYSLYNITLAAVEKDDSVGGIITSLNVKYINTSDK